MKNSEALKVFERDLEAAKKALVLATNPHALKDLSPELRNQIQMATQISEQEEPTLAQEEYVKSLEEKYKELIKNNKDASGTR